MGRTIVVSSCHRLTGGSLTYINHPDYLSTLRKLTSERLYEHYVQGDHDIFAELSESDWGFILYQWGTNWMIHNGESHSAVQEYVMGLIDRKPEYLGLLLRSFAQENSSEGGVTFRFEEFSQVYDPVVIINRLDRYGDSALTTPEERRVVELFRQHAALRLPQPSDTVHQ